MPDRPAVIPMDPPMVNPPVRDETGQIAEVQPPANRNRVHQPSRIGYTDVSICIGTVDKDGHRVEVVHQVDSVADGVRITHVNHSTKEKMRAVREDGALIGHEPTGEYEVTLKFTYFKE